MKTKRKNRDQLGEAGSLPEPGETEKGRNPSPELKFRPGDLPAKPASTGANPLARGPHDDLRPFNTMRASEAQRTIIHQDMGEHADLERDERTTRYAEAQLPEQIPVTTLQARSQPDHSEQALAMHARLRPTEVTVAGEQLARLPGRVEPISHGLIQEGNDPQRFTRAAHSESGYGTVADSPLSRLPESVPARDVHARTKSGDARDVQWPNESQSGISVNITVNRESEPAESEDERTGLKIRRGLTRGYGEVAGPPSEDDAARLRQRPWFPRRVDPRNSSVDYNVGIHGPDAGFHVAHDQNSPLANLPEQVPASHVHADAKRRAEQDIRKEILHPYPGRKR